LSNASKKEEYNRAVHQPFIDFMKAYGSVRREVLYNIPLEVSMPVVFLWLQEHSRTSSFSLVPSPSRTGLKRVW
jgi:hypothetical protein